MMRKSVLILFLAAALALAAYTFREREDILKSLHTDTIPVPEGLNHLFGNEMSDLEVTERMEKDIERFMARWEITGASLAIMKDGRLLYSKGFGYADREQGIKTDVRHIFRIASVSKLITATAVMKLCDEGLLGLDDTVFGEDGILDDPRFLDIRDKRVRNITVEHLLRHRAGYSIRAGDPLFNSANVARNMGMDAPLSLDDMVAHAASSRLRFNPGSSNIYSNLGYVVLAKVIEKVSGTDYETYVKQNILYPLGCSDMHIGKTYYEDKFPNEVKYYEPDDAEPVQPFDGRDTLVPRRYGGCDMQVLGGAGGWVASPTELMKFVSAIDPGNKDIPRIISDSAIGIMTESRKDVYPVGWMRVSEDGEWRRTGTLAGTSVMLRRQKNGYTWIFVTNSSSWSGSRFPGKIDVLIRDALSRIKEWPERDLFQVKSENF